METRRRRTRVVLKGSSRSSSGKRTEQRREHHRLELSDDSETSDSVFTSGSETFLVPSSQTSQDKAPPSPPLKEAMDEQHHDGSKIPTDSGTSSINCAKTDMPRPLISTLQSHYNPHPVGIRQLCAGSSPEETASDEITSSDVDRSPKSRLSEATHGWSENLHTTHPVGVVKTSNRNLPPLPNTYLRPKCKPKGENRGENKSNYRISAFKLPKPSLPFGLNKTGQVHPETMDLSHNYHQDQSTPNTLGRDLLTPSGSLPTPMMRLSPLLSSSLRLGGCFKLVDGSGRQIFTPEDHLESCFSDRHVRVFIITWNMQEMKELPDSVEDLLLPLHQELAADMYVIGTQESTPAKKEWELLLQKTLGPSYVPVQTAALGVVYLSFFLRRDLIWFCSSVKTATFATRPLTYIKTKGGVGLSFSLFGSTFLFITAHFTASQHKVTERNSDMQRIASNLGLTEDTSPTNDEDVTTKFDYVFWCGDLNYRVDLDRDIVDQYISDLNYMSLLLEDQLTKEILQGNVFQGFSEHPISFPPSYKYDLETDDYDTSEKQRVPSWTDRILFKSRAGEGIAGVSYYSFPSLKCSDHKPVCATFKVKLSPSSDVEGVPDTIASFNRELYIKANRQRKVLTEQLLRSEEEVDSRPAEPLPSHDAQSNKRQKQVTSQICVII